MKVKFLLFSILLLLAVSWPAHAEEHAYVLLYTDQENALSAQAVEKLAAINVRLIGHIKIVDAALPNDQIKPPIAASLFIGGDTEYLSFASDLGEIHATILHGKISQEDGLAYFEKAPMAAIVLSPKTVSAPENSLSVDITHRLTKDASDMEFYGKIKQISIHPISFDDNPMEFMPGDNANGMMGLIGEFLR